ncbi:hypothetical protein GQR58_019563 [Nymphon striatum]|nr:hypothetical protein GQR58_019563 [Nymphon striatum]
MARTIVVGTAALRDKKLYERVRKSDSIHQKPHALRLMNALGNQNYVGAYPELRYYDIDRLKFEERSVFLAWYDSVKEDLPFDFKRELIDYCTNDVEILARLCLVYRKLFLTAEGVDPLQNVTVASACMQSFKSKLRQQLYNVDVELYSLTMAKRRYLLDKGIKYVCIWYHEYAKQLKDDIEFKHFAEELDVVERLDPSDALFGGMKNATCLYYKPLKGEQIKYGGKLLFPLCKTCAAEGINRQCLCSDEERSLNGTWFTVELIKALFLNYKKKLKCMKCGITPKHLPTRLHLKVFSQII